MHQWVELRELPVEVREEIFKRILDQEVNGNDVENWCNAAIKSYLARGAEGE